MFSLYSYCTRRGQVAARLVVRKLRQWPPGIGVGSLAMQIEDRDIERLGLELLLGIGYCGLSSVQMKKDAETGKASIIEVNAGRPALNMPIAEFCGVEMQMAYYCEAAGLPLPVQNGILRPGAKWICIKTDLAAAVWHWRHHDLGFADWWRTVQGPKVHAVHSWRDPAPFLLDLLRKTPARRWLPLRQRPGDAIRGSWRNS